MCGVRHQLRRSDAAYRVERDGRYDSRLHQAPVVTIRDYLRRRFNNVAIIAAPLAKRTQMPQEQRSL
jgi:hypothetical protein